MKKRLLVLGMAVMLTISTAITGCGKKSGSDEGGKETTDKKVGCILGVGGLGDQSFNDLIYEGLKKAKEEEGIPFDHAEPIQVSDFEVMMRDMATSNEYEVIICVGFDATDALTIVSKEFPEQKFAFIDGSLEADNVVNYAAKEEEVAFLAGSLAGLMKANPTEYKVQDDNTIGFIAALETPILLKWNAGYQSGAQYVNKDIKCQADFVAGDNPFGDTTTAKEIATAQFNKGADIIAHAAGGSGLGIFDAATDYNFYAIGCNSNQNLMNPDVVVASMLKRVDTAAYNIAKAACIDENLQMGTTVVLGLADEGVDLTFEGSNVEVRDEDKEIIETIKKQIIDGEITVPYTMDKVDEFVKNNSFQTK